MDSKLQDIKVPSQKIRVEACSGYHLNEGWEISIGANEKIK